MRMGNVKDVLAAKARISFTEPELDLLIRAVEKAEVTPNELAMAVNLLERLKMTKPDERAPLEGRSSGLSGRVRAGSY